MIPEILTKCHNMYCLNLKRHYLTLFLSDCIRTAENEWLNIHCNFTGYLCYRGLHYTTRGSPHRKTRRVHLYSDCKLIWTKICRACFRQNCEKSISLSLKRKYTYIKRGIGLAIAYATKHLSQMQIVTYLWRSYGNHYEICCYVSIRYLSFYLVPNIFIERNFYITKHLTIKARVIFP